MDYYAHSVENMEKSTWQLLKTHLIEVAKMSADFCSVFDAADIGYVSGLYHDLGKYSTEFQLRIRGGCEKVDHSTAGAKEVSKLYPNGFGRLMSYVIAGHHTGLQDFGSPEAGLCKRLKNEAIPDYSNYVTEVEKISTEFTIPKQFSGSSNNFSVSFYTRMIFSSVCDADFLNTESFMQPYNSTLRGCYAGITELLFKFDKYMSDKFKYVDQSSINSYRKSIYNDCVVKSEHDCGFYSLTVPTGGGKTLSSMAFALNHAAKHDLERIIYVIPYTSIIEQNAGVFRDIFGVNNVLEHHSNFDSVKLKISKDTDEDNNTALKMKLASENWDAPIVVTTNVQFFESLFARKPSRCRKLHNLAKSVIVLDEAQMIPTEFMKPCIAALTELVVNYGATVVFCTATQPKLTKLLDSKLKPEEIVQAPLDLYKAFKRVTVADLGMLSDDVLFSKLENEKQVLCVVNTRKHAQNLFNKFKDLENCYHLSARMCPVHRTKVLNKIKIRLSNGDPCKVISTQLIEAGVDIDFPVVYKSMAGIDSICQAAGRCNREAKNITGNVYVFQSSEKYGSGNNWLSRASSLGEIVLSEFEDPIALDAIDLYFGMLYKRGSLDKYKVVSMLSDKHYEFLFETASDVFKFIDNSMINIIIPYDDRASCLIDNLKAGGLSFETLRSLQGYTISIYATEFEELLKLRKIDILFDSIYVLSNNDNLYREDIGLSNGMDLPF